MARIAYFVLFILLINPLFINAQSKRDNLYMYGREAFAKIEGGTITFISDTVAYKKFLTDNLVEVAVNFDKIEVRKQFTLNTKKEFYYILATNKANNITVAKWLNKKGNTLYINNKFKMSKDLFEQTYLTCTGNDDCTPQVWEDEEGRQWVCSEKIACSAPGDDKNTCVKTTTVFGP